MNKVKRLNITYTLQHIVPSDRETKLVNTLRISANTTDRHLDKVYEITKWLRDNKLDFITEARFVKGGRADIIVLQMGIAVEVLVTETIESFLKNKSKYPIQVLPVAYNDEFKGI